MSSQNRIAELCQRALESESKKEARMPDNVAAALRPFLLKDHVPGEEIESAPPAVVEEAPAAEQPAAASAKPSAEEEAELRAMIDARDETLRKKAKRRSIAINTSLFLLIGGAAAGVALSPTLRAKAFNLKGHLEDGVEDVKLMGNLTGSYDEALAGVAQRGNQIKEATSELGIDPGSIDENEDPHMQAELDTMMGGGAPTTGDRQAKLQRAGSIVTAITGRQAPEVKTVAE